MLGFSRIEPFPASIDKKCIHLNLFLLKEKKETKWYPGYNVYGEGIFIEFDEDAINKWRSGNTVLEKRIKTLQDNYDNSFLEESHNPCERYLVSFFCYILFHICL